MFIKIPPLIFMVIAPLMSRVKLYFWFSSISLRALFFISFFYVYKENLVLSRLYSHFAFIQFL